MYDPACWDCTGNPLTGKGKQTKAKHTQVFEKKTQPAEEKRLEIPENDFKNTVQHSLKNVTQRDDSLLYSDRGQSVIIAPSTVILHRCDDVNIPAEKIYSQTESFFNRKNLKSMMLLNLSDEEESSAHQSCGGQKVLQYLSDVSNSSQCQENLALNTSSDSSVRTRKIKRRKAKPLLDSESDSCSGGHMSRFSRTTANEKGRQKSKVGSDKKKLSGGRSFTDTGKDEDSGEESGDSGVIELNFSRHSWDRVCFDELQGLEGSEDFAPSKVIPVASLTGNLEYGNNRLSKRSGKIISCSQANEHEKSYQKSENKPVHHDHSYAYNSDSAKKRRKNNSRSVPPKRKLGHHNFSFTSPLSNQHSVSLLSGKRSSLDSDVSLSSPYFTCGGPIAPCLDMMNEGRLSNTPSNASEVPNIFDSLSTDISSGIAESDHKERFIVIFSADEGYKVPPKMQRIIQPSFEDSDRDVKSKDQTNRLCRTTEAVTTTATFVTKPCLSSSESATSEVNTNSLLKSVQSKQKPVYMSISKSYKNDVELASVTESDENYPNSLKKESTKAFKSFTKEAKETIYINNTESESDRGFRSLPQDHPNVLAKPTRKLFRKKSSKYQKSMTMKSACSFIRNELFSGRPALFVESEIDSHQITNVMVTTLSGDSGALNKSASLITDECLHSGIPVTGSESQLHTSGATYVNCSTTSEHISTSGAKTDLSIEKNMLTEHCSLSTSECAPTAEVNYDSEIKNKPVGFSTENRNVSDIDQDESNNPVIEDDKELEDVSLQVGPETSSQADHSRSSTPEIPEELEVDKSDDDDPDYDELLQSAYLDDNERDYLMEADDEEQFHHVHCEMDTQHDSETADFNDRDVVFPDGDNNAEGHFTALDDLRDQQNNHENISDGAYHIENIPHGNGDDDHYEGDLLADNENRDDGESYSTCSSQCLSPVRKPIVKFETGCEYSQEDESILDYVSDSDIFCNLSHSVLMESDSADENFVYPDMDRLTPVEETSGLQVNRSKSSDYEMKYKHGSQSASKEADLKSSLPQVFRTKYDDIDGNDNSNYISKTVESNIVAQSKVTEIHCKDDSSVHSEAKADNTSTKQVSMSLSIDHVDKSKGNANTVEIQQISEIRFLDAAEKCHVNENFSAGASKGGNLVTDLINNESGNVSYGSSRESSSEDPELDRNCLPDVPTVSNSELNYDKSINDFDETAWLTIKTSTSEKHSSPIGKVNKSVHKELKSETCEISPVKIGRKAIMIPLLSNADDKKIALRTGSFYSKSVKKPVFKTRRFFTTRSVRRNKIVNSANQSPLRRKIATARKMMMERLQKSAMNKRQSVCTARKSGNRFASRQDKMLLSMSNTESKKQLEKSFPRTEEKSQKCVTNETDLDMLEGGPTRIEEDSVNEAAVMKDNSSGPTRQGTSSGPTGQGRSACEIIQQASPSTSSDHSSKQKDTVSSLNDELQSGSSSMHQLHLEQQTPVTSLSYQSSMDDFLGCILKWQPAWLWEQDKFANLPPVVDENTVWPLLESYDSLDDYHAIMKPLLLLETWKQISNNWKDLQKSSDRRKLHHVAPVRVDNVTKSTLNLHCQVIPREDIEHGAFVMESDLVLLTLKYRQDGTTGTHDVFGYITKLSKCHAKATSESLHPALSNHTSLGEKCVMNVTVKLRYRSLQIHENELMDMQVITSVVNSVRRFQALLHLPKSVLVRDILRPVNAHVFKHSSLSLKLPPLQGKFNGNQKDAIERITDQVLQSYVLPKISLLHGPPGTGKSHTVSGLVQHILQCGRNAGQRPRILLCAPSNNALDELALRLSRQNNTAWKESPVNFVRIGKQDVMNPKVRQYSVKELVKKNHQARIDLSSGVLGSIKTKLHNLEKKILFVKSKLTENEEVKDEIEIHKWSTNLASLEKQKLQLEQHAKQRSAAADQMDSRTYAALQQELLLKADVLCCTLSSSACHLMMDTFLSSAEKQHHFTCVIVDEATQCTELDTLIPLLHGCSKLVLVGDPLQLPATVLSKKAVDMNFAQSLFQRLYWHFRFKEDNPVMMLNTQYRMHPHIVQFPNQYMYDSQLTTDKHIVVKRTKFPFAHYLLFDVQYGEEASTYEGSISNEAEAEFVMHLVDLMKKKISEAAIGIITPYQKQKFLIQNHLRERNSDGILCGTVDGFQGGEKDVIILSCVRALSRTGGIGFLADRLRMNVALTRAKYALYIVGHLSSLSVDEDWKTLIQNGEERQVVVPVVSQSETNLALRHCLAQHSK